MNKILPVASRFENLLLLCLQWNCSTLEMTRVCVLYKEYGSLYNSSCASSDVSKMEIPSKEIYREIIK